MFIGGHQGEFKNLGGGQQEAIGGIAMGKSQASDFPRDFISDWSFSEWNCTKLVRNPRVHFLVERDSSLLREDDYFPNADGRKPEFIVRIANLLDNSLGMWVSRSSLISGELPSRPRQRRGK
jgi:hypothetical protein